MKTNYQTYWESSWKEEDSSQLQAYLEGWKNYHGMLADAKRAIGELFRITRNGGLVIVSFDSAEEEDFSEEYVEIEPGTMQYISGSRAGMLFHPYEWDEIGRLLEDYQIVEKWTNQKEEKIVVLMK